MIAAEGIVYRGMDQAALDASMNNGKAVAAWPELLRKWRTKSAELRARHPGYTELRYGPAPRHRIDWFPVAGSDAPVIVFIHGGYWQWNDKEDFSFIAEGALKHGFSVALLEYTLAPAARIGGIVTEIGTALDFLDATLPMTAGGTGFFLIGHSAGGHLAEHQRARRSVIGCLAISGIFDLEPVALSYINAPLQLSSEEIETYSPIRHPIRGAPLLFTVGELELPGLLRQTREYEVAAQAAGQAVTTIAAPSCNHFDILELFANPDGPLLKAVEKAAVASG